LLTRISNTEPGHSLGDSADGLRVRAIGLNGHRLAAGDSIDRTNSSAFSRDAGT
jgi:hypothetical protein